MPEILKKIIKHQLAKHLATALSTGSTVEAFNLHHVAGETVGSLATGLFIAAGWLL